jgi:hypothetical protein
MAVRQPRGGTAAYLNRPQPSDPAPTVTEAGFWRRPDAVVALQVAPSITQTASAGFSG